MRTDEKLQEIVDRLHSNCGDIHEAARWCGVSPAFVYSWIKDDKVAADALNEAQRVGWAGLESEAIRRAVHGVNEDVYYKGMAVGTKTVYSDGLLGKLMEARLPEYKKGEGAMNQFNGPTQINIMPRANTYDEWLAMRDTTLQRRDAEAAAAVSDEAKAAYALMAPPEQIEEATFEEIPPDRPLAGLAGLGL